MAPRSVNGFARNRHLAMYYSGLRGVTTSGSRKQETALPAFTFAAFEPVRDEPQPATTLRRSLHDFDRLSALVARWSKHRDAFREAWSEMIGLKQEDDTYPANSVERQLRVLEEALSKAKVPPTINL